MDTMARGNSQQLHASDVSVDFVDWLPQPFSVQLILRPEHGKWYAMAREYDVTGMGDSPKEAAQEVIELVMDYLLAYFREGSPYEATLRPVSLNIATRIESQFGTILSSILRGAAEKVPLPRRKRITLPSVADACAHLAH